MSATPYPHRRISPLHSAFAILLSLFLAALIGAKTHIALQRGQEVTMTCPTCTADTTYPIDAQKAKVVKSKSLGQTTHRIYRCTYPDCGETFHTIEIPRERFRALETIEREAQAFADRWLHYTKPQPSGVPR